MTSKMTTDALTEWDTNPEWTKHASEARYSELQTLYEISQAILSSRDTKTILEGILDKTLRSGFYDLGVIRLLDIGGQVLEPAVFRGFQKPEKIRAHRLEHAMREKCISKGMTSNEPLVVENVPNCEGLRTFKQEGVKTAVIIPVRAEEKVLGVIQLGNRTSKKLQHDEIRLLKTIGNQLGIAVQKVRLYEETQRNLERIRALHEIDLSITSTLDLPTVLNNLLEKIDLFLPCASATTIRLLNYDTGQLEFITCRNIALEEMNAYSKKAKRGFTDIVFESKAPLLIPDVKTDPRGRDLSFFLRHGFVSYLGVPLIAKNEILGVLSFVTMERHEFNSQEIDFLQTLGSQAAIAISNSQLYEQSRNRASDLQRANTHLRRQEEIQKVLKELSQDIIFLDHDKLLEKLTASAVRFLKADIADVRLLDGETWQLRGLSGIRLDRLPPSWRSSSSAKQRSKWIREHRQPLRIPDITAGFVQSIGKVLESLGIRGFLGVPILSRQGEVIGILRILTYSPRHFTDQEMDLLQQLANGAAVALENRRLLEEIQKQALVLEKANKVKDEFLSIVSHELRTPIAAVIGYTQMIKDGVVGKINHQQAQALGKISKNSQELLTVINSIMEATRIEAGATRAEWYPVELGMLLDELKLSYEVVLDKELELRWNCPAGIPAVRTDGDKLKHVLQNLIGNAIKFTAPGGTVTLSASYMHEQQVVEFKVADTGIGIPEDQLPKIFEMFHQVDSSQSRTYGGIGLGLYIVKKFTELIGAKVEVESKVGQGSTFIVTLPINN